MSLDQAQIDAVQEASGHSIFGSSSLPRIVQCPASVGEELRAGLRPSSPYAEKGTLMHGWTEQALSVTAPKEFIMAEDLSIDDTSYIIDAIDYFYKVLEKHNDRGIFTLESRGSLQSYGLPEVYGTKDVSIKSPKRIDVIDWKFGHGISVSAKKNIQCISYLGMEVPYQDIPDTDMELYVHIAQPPKGIFEEYRVSFEELYHTLLGTVTDAIRLARSVDPPYGPSESACRFCNANMRCIQRHQWLQQQAKLVQQASQNRSAVSNEMWSKFLIAASALKQAIKDTENYAVREIQSGHEFPGYKVVSGRATRKFVDEEAGQAFIIDCLGTTKAYKKKEVISLAQAEKVDKTLKKDDDWKALIHKPEGAPKLVPEGAPGKALKFGNQSVFDEMASGKL